MLKHLHERPRAPARVLILGANGFVPRALCSHLTKVGIPAFAIGSARVNLVDPSSSRSLTELLRSDDALVMTAALTPDKGRDMATLIQNLRMAETVAAAVTARPCAHLVYFSSDAVYNRDSAVVSEAQAAAPVDLYGVMHLARELALGEMASKVGIPFCTFRPCAIYGFGDTHNSYGPNRFIRTALSEGKIRLFGDGEETRDHVYIDDVVRLTQLALLHASSGVLNLASGQAVAFARVAAEIVSMAGRAVTIESLPRVGTVTHRRFDMTALSKSFPDHTPTSLSVGLGKTISRTLPSDRRSTDN